MTNAEAMERVIEALHSAAKALDEAANQLAGQNVPKPEVAGTAEKTTTSAKEEKTLTLEEVRKVAADKARQGHTEEVRQLIQKFGADKLSGVDAAKYPALMEELEAIGNAN